MRIALVGCGYVADFYLRTLVNHPELSLVGVMDRDPERAIRFASFYRVPRIASLTTILENPDVDIVVNLTNPRSHFEVSHAALEAGKHVYSEKPLAMSLPEAKELVALAERKKLHLGGAPCSVLGETAQTLWKAIRNGKIGAPRLAYAEIDDGPVHLMDHASWTSDSGNVWPAKDEFEVGCTLEHAGYYVTWLVAFFGAARRVTTFTSCLVPDKGIVLSNAAVDFSVGCIEFESGVVARLTCSIFAPHDHRLRIVGDAGVLSIDECWDYGAPVSLQRRTKLGLRAEKFPRASKLVGLGARRVPLVRKPTFQYKARGSNPMDFMRGVAELAASIRERRPCRLSSGFALHVNEIALALQDPGTKEMPRELTTRCGPMDPMPWA